MRDLAPMSFLLLGGACTVSAPPPADAPDPPAASTGEVREEAAAFDPSAADPLAGCTEARFDPTVTWSCGPHTVVLARYEQGMPPDTPGEYRGGAPEQAELTIPGGDRTLTARVLSQPAIDTSAHRLTVLVRDEAESQVASCAVRIEPNQGEEALKAWCGRVLERALAPAAE